uniref:TylF/MycF/NovP-related O-methyltransferase n=1 Tax=Trichloromonas sp. TaxID=3069249 RepID=UPI003D815E33
GKPLRLFDTFSGMPETDTVKDFHNKGDFSNTNLTAVKKVVGERSFVKYEPGFIPDTFASHESAQICFAHIDVDIYQSVMDCCDFIFPRLVEGGFMVFDDYGFPTCPGARQAVDEYFSSQGAVPICLPTGQAIVFKPPVPARLDAIS